MDNKKYHWLKLPKDFFQNPKIKKLRRIAGGDTYTVIYQKLMLLTLITDGILEYEQIEDTFAEELSLILDEKEDNIKITLSYLQTQGLMEQLSNNTYLLSEVPRLIGRESSSAERVRRHREKKLLPLDTINSKPIAKTNSERQKSFRAKKTCEKKNIPLVEDYINSKRYGGNYYLVMQRDSYSCAECNVTENLCVHHIDGYFEEKPENNATNKMITLCRKCHSNVHASATISEEQLDRINYFDSNIMLPSNAMVTNCNTEIELEIELELDKEIDKEKNIKKKKFDFLLSSKRQVQTLSKEYIHQLEVYVDSLDGNNLPLQEFLDGCEMKGYQYKNFKLAYNTWNKSFLEKQILKKEKKSISQKNDDFLSTKFGNSDAIDCEVV